MAGRTQQSSTILGKWLRNRKITITQLAEDLGIAYRTAWLAVHGYKISFDNAEKICRYVGNVKGITVKSLCSAPPRANLVPTE